MSENGSEIGCVLAAHDRRAVSLGLEGDEILCHFTGASLPPHVPCAVRRNKRSLLKHLPRAARNALFPRLTLCEPSTQASLSSIQRRIWSPFRRAA